jgi:LysM repeat protein
MKKFLVFIVGLLILMMATSIASAQQAGLLPITYQKFERGYMVWRADTGHVWVLGNTGILINYPASSYGRLPDNRITPPTGLRAPIMGFGKVWGNNQAVRDLIGYAVSDEASANANYQLVTPTNVVFLAFGDVTAQIEPDSRWVSNTLTNTARVTSFTMTPTAPRANDNLVVNWATEGGEFVMVELHDATGRLMGSPVVGTSGATTLIIPNTNKITVTVWVMRAINGAYQRLSFQSQTLNVTGATGNNPPPTGTCASGSTYIVQRGDTLYRIARNCGVTLDALATRNNITNRNRIFTGQRLIIP